MSAEQSRAWKAVRRFLVVIIGILLIILFILWRAENPRIERLRFALFDVIVPNTTYILKPIKVISQIFSDFQSYNKLYQQNQDLKNELQKMRGWKEVALQLEEKNAQLSILNNVKIRPTINWVTGEVIADSGSPFNKSVIINIGSIDGIVDGSAAMDGLGLIGRVSGVGEKNSRVLLLTDISSSIPILIAKTGQKGLIRGDNTDQPILSFLEAAKTVKAGMRVVTSGDGQVLPADLLIGTISKDRTGQLRVILAAEFSELDYLRVLLNNEREIIKEPGNLIIK